MSRYALYVTPIAWNEMKKLPGNVRQRVRRTVSALADEPRPSNSKALEVVGVQREVRRLR